MIRALIAVLLPVLLPFAGYFLWIHWHRKRQSRLGLNPDARPEVPTIWLLTAGMVLMVMTVGLLYLYSDQGAPPGTPYQPPRATDVNPNAWPVGDDQMGGPDAARPATPTPAAPPPQSAPGGGAYPTQ